MDMEQIERIMVSFLPERGEVDLELQLLLLKPTGQGLTSLG